MYLTVSGQTEIVLLNHMLAVWIIIVVIALGISLYNHFDARNSSMLSLVFEQRNRRYGAYALRKSYAFTMLLTLSGLTVLTLIAIAPHVELFGGSTATNFTQSPSDNVPDTTLLSLDIPPEDATKTLPPSVSIKADRGNGGQNTADAEEIKKSDGEESEENETSENSANSSNSKSTESSSKPIKKYNGPKTNDREIDDGAAQIDAQMEAARKRREEREAKKKQREQDAQRSSGNTQNSSKGNESSGKTEDAADFNLPGRTPFNNERHYLNFPSFTCYKGGTVVVKIKVDSGGNVVYAEALDAENMDYCLKSHAEKYAKKARFNASSKSMQEGTLTYRFKAQ